MTLLSTSSVGTAVGKPSATSVWQPWLAVLGFANGTAHHLTETIAVSLRSSFWQICARYPQVGVLIVGAGPTGLGAATRLNQHGYDDWRVIDMVGLRSRFFLLRSVHDSSDSACLSLGL